MIALVAARNPPLALSHLDLAPTFVVQPKTTRFVRIAQSAGSDKFLHVQQVQVYIEGSNKNVALASEGATASTSSSAWEGKPEYAIDGNVNENQAWPNSCHTKGQGNSEWWVVDLKHDYEVVKVVVYATCAIYRGGLRVARDDSTR